MRRDRAGAREPVEAQRWTPAQAGRFIEYTADAPLGLLYRVMVLGAARRSGVCGFRWAFERDTINIRRS